MKRPSVEANEGLIQQASVQAVNHPIAQVTKYRQVSTGAIIGASSSETTARSSKATSKRVQISVYPILQATKDPTKRFVHRHKRHKRSWQNIMASRSIDASVTANQSPIIPGAKQTCRSEPRSNQTSNGPRCYVSTRASIRAIEEECAWAIGIFKARSIKTSRSIEVIVQLSKKLPAWSKGIEASNVATKCPIAS